MDTKRCSENSAETSEGKTIILQAEFDEFGLFIPDEYAKVLGLTFSVDIRRYKFFLIRSPYAKVMAV